MIGSARRTTRTAVAALALTLAATLNGPAASAAGTVDQAQLTDPNGSIAFYLSEPIAQTVTAGRTGGLDRVDLQLGWSTEARQVFVTVRDVKADGTPSGAALAKQVVPVDQIEQFPAITTVTFQEPAVVAEGDQYAVVVRSDYPTDTTDMRWYYASAAPYPDGTAQAKTVPGGPWFLQPFDLGFATYVDPGVDNDADGFINFADCDDSNSAVNPDATEVYNRIDDDCDDLTDEGFTVAGAPAIGEASSGARGGAVTATARWSEPATNGGLPIGAYQVQAQKLNAAGSVVARDTRVVGNEARSLTFRLSEGRYTFRVAAFNAEGRSPWSRSSAIVRAR